MFGSLIGILLFVVVSLTSVYVECFRPGLSCHLPNGSAVLQQLKVVFPEMEDLARD